MIMARATKDYLYDKIERQREKLREEGREALAAEVEGWNRRRLEAEKRGDPFNEPPPERIEHYPKARLRPHKTQSAGSYVKRIQGCMGCY